MPEAPPGSADIGLTVALCGLAIRGFSAPARVVRELP